MPNNVQMYRTFCLISIHMRHSRADVNPALHHTSYNYFGLQGVAVTTLTKTIISHLEIIVQSRSHFLSTRLEMLNTTNYVRIPVDGIANVYWGTLWCFRITLVLKKNRWRNWTHFDRWVPQNCSRSGNNSGENVYLPVENILEGQSINSWIKK